MEIVDVDQFIADTLRSAGDKPEGESTASHFLSFTHSSEGPSAWILEHGTIGWIVHDEAVSSVLPLRETQTEATEVWLRDWLPRRRTTTTLDLAAKFATHFDADEIDELNRAFDEAVDISSGEAESHPALEDLKQSRLSDEERIEATLGGLLKRFALRRMLLARSLSLEEVAVRLGIKPNEVEERRERRELVAISDRNGAWVFPEWQFDRAGERGLLSGLLPVLPMLEDLGPLQSALWLSQGKPALDGQSPVEALLRGEGEKIELLARRVSALRS